MRLVFLQNGKNCKTDEIPEAYATMKKWFKEGKNSEYLFKVDSKLCVDLDARDSHYAAEHKRCQEEAPKKQRVAEAKRMA